MLPSRDESRLKDGYGKLLVVGGSVGYTGAVYLTATAAVHSGCGLVYAAVPKEIWQVEAVKLTEAMPFPLEENAADQILERLEKCSALAIGPGLGRAGHTQSMVLDVLLRTDKPVVADADALFALSGCPDVLDSRRGKVTILTPHPGEYERLAGSENPGDFARKHGVYLVAKSHRTMIYAPDGREYRNTTGNSGLAKGGSGDVLTGIIASFLCQGMEAFEACRSAVYLHGRAADILLEKETAYCMTAESLIKEGLREAFKECLAKKK